MVGPAEEFDDATEGAEGEDEATSDVDEVSEVRAANDAGNMFQGAVAAWRALGLSKLVSSLDATASEMVDQQRESLLQRKELAQKTKDFRKLDDPAKLGEIKELLKMYQGYIDVLTQHNKTVSAAFMSAYSPLSEAPDPYPLLEASIDSFVTADVVVPKLESENERLHEQTKRLNAQLEETEARLEQERSKRQSFEGSQDSRIKEVEESWSAVLKEKEGNWAAKEKSLEEKADSQEKLLKELKANYEVSQRLEQTGEDVQDVSRSSATAAELDIVNRELERTSIRLAEVEARNERLRIELAQSTSQSNSSSRSTTIDDDPAFSRLRSENSSLRRKLDTARFDKDAERTNLENKLRGVEREIGSLQADREALQTKVQRWSDYDDVKRELDMLRAIEFAGAEDGEIAEVEDASQTNGSANKQAGESLEQLLVARNKKLGNELTELRVSHQGLQRRFEELQEELSSTNMDLEKARNLNATLENDLQKTQQEASNAFETMTVAGTYTSRHPKSQYSMRRGGGASPTSSIIGGFESSSGYGTPTRTTLESLRAGEPVGGGSGILPMVTAQRDRFKKKIGELEVELQKQYQTLSSLRSEVASLQKDNLTLYEKTRYVSTYNRSQPVSSGAAYGSNPNPSAVQVGAADTPSGLGLNRYRSAYEQNISPFAAFRSRESARALKRMSIPERAVFQVTRMVLATRASRNLFAMYCLALHLLVFVMLYWMGASDIERHASNLGANAIAGSAAKAAANAALGGGSEHGEWQQEGFRADS